MNTQRDRYTEFAELPNYEKMNRANAALKAVKTDQQTGATCCNGQCPSGFCRDEKDRKKMEMRNGGDATSVMMLTHAEKAALMNNPYIPYNLLPLV